MAGYSITPLSRKLGIKHETKIKLLNAPADYMKLLDIDIKKQLIDRVSEADLLHLFVTSKTELRKEFLGIIEAAKEKAVIWISWYKKSAGIPTDITEDVIREIVLPTGWVDIKVCTVSDLWSGLKIVKRKNK